MSTGFLLAASVVPALLVGLAAGFGLGWWRRGARRRPVI